MGRRGERESAVGVVVEERWCHLHKMHTSSVWETQIQEEQAGIDSAGKSCTGIWFYLNSRGQQVVVFPPRQEKEPLVQQQLNFFLLERILIVFLISLQNGRAVRLQERITVKSTSAKWQAQL